jgi:hypothetical protein
MSILSFRLGLVIAIGQASCLGYLRRYFGVSARLENKGRQGMACCWLLSVLARQHQAELFAEAYVQLGLAQREIRPLNILRDNRRLP